MLNHQGKIYSDKNTLLFSAQNRAFSYSDALFETIRVVRKNVIFEIPLWEYHFKRLSRGMTAYGFEPLNSDFLKGEILKTAFFSIKNLTEQSDFKARLTAFRTEGGLYTPQQSKSEFVIVLTEIPKIKEIHIENNIESFQKSYVFFEELPIFPSAFSTFKKTDALPYVLAGKYKKEQKAEEVFLLNTEKRIAEAGAANVFLLDKKTEKEWYFITPPISEGGVMGAMRSFLLDNFSDVQMGDIKIILEEKSISKEKLIKSEIIFTTNAVQSVRLIKIKNREVRVIEKWISQINQVFR